MSLLEILSKPREEANTNVQSQPEKPVEKTSKLVPRALRAKHVAASSSSKSAKPSASPAAVPPQSQSTTPRQSSPAADTRESLQEGGKETKEFGTTFSLTDIVDLYDPQRPNSYYHTVYQPMREAAEKSAVEAAKEENEMEVDSGGPTTSSYGSRFGEKMLYRQGWKGRGHGLGKMEQGRSTPLKHVEVATGSNMRPIGVITQEEILEDQTSVMVLRNMVERGQIDELLEVETRQECSTFGSVLHSLICQSPDSSSLSDSDAVRIFVQFADSSSANAAIAALNGRSFAGRSVLASPYPEAAFSQCKYWLPLN